MARKWITVDVYSKFIEIFLSKEGLNEPWRRGGARLVRSTPDRVFRVRALVGVIVLCS